MKNYGRDPDSDVREIIKDEMSANDAAASELETTAKYHRAEADKLSAKAAEFRAANETFAKQMALLEAVLGPLIEEAA